MITQALYVLVFLYAFAYIKYVFLPQRAIEKKKAALQALGYNVMVLPFTPLKSAWRQMLTRDYKKHGDAHFTFKLPEASRADIVVNNLFDKVVVQIVNPQVIKQFFRPQNIYNYHKVTFIFDNLIQTLGGGGLIFSQDDQWKRKRRILNAAFTFDFIKANIPTIVRQCNNCFELFQQSSEESLRSSRILQNQRYKLTIMNIYSRIFVNVITEMFFGSQAVNQKVNDQDFAAFVKRLIADLAIQGYQINGLILGHWIYKIGLNKRDRDILKRKKIFQKVSESFVRKRFQEIKQNGYSENPTDIIQVLMKSGMISQGKDQQKLGIKQIINEFGVFTVAGSDTTSVSMSAMTYFIALNPQVQKKLRNLVDEHFKSDEDITYQKIKDLKYFDWTINETLRFTAPTPLFYRSVQKDHLIGKIQARKGEIWTVQFVPNHFNPKNFKNPQQFRPERWDTETNELPAYSYTAFSGGPRVCIGKQIAQFNLKVTLIKLLQRYQKITLPVTKLRFQTRLLYQPDVLQCDLIKRKRVR